MKKYLYLIIALVVASKIDVMAESLIKNDEYDHFVNCCEKYNVDEKLALSILIVENPKGDNSIIKENSDGTYDYGYFQINTCNIECALKGTGCENITDPKNNIECGIYLISLSKLKLIKKWLDTSVFNIAMQYHLPSDLIEFYVNNNSDTKGYRYAVKVTDTYNYLKVIERKNKNGK